MAKVMENVSFEKCRLEVMLIVGGDKREPNMRVKSVMGSNGGSGPHREHAW